MKSFKATLMLNLTCLATFLAAFNAQAISFEVIGACSAEPLHQGSFELSDLKISAGATSVAIFDQHRIPYVGNESGFNSIVNSPVGLDSIEVISDTKMRAYGWCYSVNGIQPEVLAGDYLFSSNDDKLVWFYAYSTYEKGEWLDYCVPSYQIKAPQFCAK